MHFFLYHFLINEDNDDLCLCRFKYFTVVGWGAFIVLMNYTRELL